MAKQVSWTKTARLQRRQVLEYWEKRNGNKNYSRKISGWIREIIHVIKTYHYIGKPTDYDNTRVFAKGDFSIFYRVTMHQLIITSFWDNRQDPDKLDEILK
jgi:plasmid stabilization system protein ParE